MSTYAQKLQSLWHEYNDLHGGAPECPKTVVEWAVGAGKLSEPHLDPMAALASDMARALREEYKTDEHGRRYRVNHAVRITKDGVQFSLWAELTTAPRPYMEKAFAQRRKQIVGDCVQLKVDVDVYNTVNSGAPPIQMIFDFTEDLEEAEAANILCADDLDAQAA